MCLVMQYWNHSCFYAIEFSNFCKYKKGLWRTIILFESA